jgi:hypothetical protein
MALTPQEQKIIQYGKAGGKSSAEIKTAVEKYRASLAPAPTPPAPKTGIGADISQAFQGGVSYFKEGMEQAKGAKNPLELVEAGLKEGAGLVGAAFSPLAPVTKYIGQGIDAIADQASNIPGVQEFAMTPAGETTARVAEDISNTAGLMSLRGLPKAATVAGKAGGVVAEGTGKTLKGAGEQLYKTTVVPEEGTRIAMQRYQASQPSLVDRVKGFVTGDKTPGATKPTTEANTAARYGLAGSEWQIGVQAKKIAGGLWDDVIDPALSEVRGSVNMNDFFSKVRNKILATTKEPSLRNARLDALDDLRAEYASNPKASLKDLQGFKEGWAEKVPESAYKGKIPGSAINFVRNTAAGEARGVIYKHAGDKARQAYIDYGNLQSIIKAGIKSVGDPAKRSLGRNVWEFVMDQAVTPVATVGGLILYRTGQGLEFIGNRGAKKVGDIVGPNDIPTRIDVQNMGGGGKVKINPSDDYYSPNLPGIQVGAPGISKFKKDTGLPTAEGNPKVYGPEYEKYIRPEDLPTIR